MKYTLKMLSVKVGRIFGEHVTNDFLGSITGDYAKKKLELPCDIDSITWDSMWITFEFTGPEDPHYPEGAEFTSVRAVWALFRKELQ